MNIQLMIEAALHAGYEPCEVLALGATKDQINAHLDTIRESQRYIAANYGRSVLPIWPNLA